MAGAGPRNSCGSSDAGSGAIGARAVAGAICARAKVAGGAGSAAAEDGSGGAGGDGSACSATRSAFDGTVSDVGCASAGDAATAAAANTHGGLRSFLLIFLGRDGESNCPPVPDCSARRR
jgi:hypothetical protein